MMDTAEQVKAQTKWSGKNVTFNSNSPKRFKIVEKAEKRKRFDSIKEYRWANKKAQHGSRASTSRGGPSANGGHSGGKRSGRSGEKK
ncbi:hypothetical protein L3X38_042869 [Prunus dulcis]|uniref:Uncharacterized protein n=1 Tax=Prunus dulcis TaxID=3755 RepID=A0AAD4UWP8_PRUDU|nr:hypothetical protein L3X38_042869 [Prunus dulcis]